MARIISTSHYVTPCAWSPCHTDVRYNGDRAVRIRTPNISSSCHQLHPPAALLSGTRCITGPSCTQCGNEFLPMLGIDPHSLTIQSVSWSPRQLNLPCCRYNAKRVFSNSLCALRNAHYRFNGFNGVTPLNGLNATYKYFPITLHDTMSINSSFWLIF